MQNENSSSSNEKWVFFALAFELKKTCICKHALLRVNVGFLVVLLSFPWRDILAFFTFVWLCCAGRHHGFGRRGWTGQWRWKGTGRGMYPLYACDTISFRWFHNIFPLHPDDFTIFSTARRESGIIFRPSSFALCLDFSELFLFLQFLCFGIVGLRVNHFHLFQPRQPPASSKGTHSTYTSSVSENAV